MLQFPLTIDTDSGSDSNHDTALYAMGSDIAEAVRSWSDDCPKCKDSLISPRFTVVGLARVGDYWTAYLTQ
ncbi:hypothetical protein LPJ75_003847 [Coemansia sp. RSA 2598]|nr:hypothetical protein LPJ75_003847 [Coemansia sp. RSA 2598]